MMGVSGGTLIDVGGLQISARIKGSGPPLLMMNGIGASLGFLRPLQDKLRDFKTICYDPVGVGKSSPLKFPLRLRRHADHALGLLDALNIEQIDLFGVSWGGALAQEFTYRHGDRVRRLVLASTTAGPGVLVSPSVLLASMDSRPRDSLAYLKTSGAKMFGGSLRTDAEALHGSGIFEHLAPKNSSVYYFQMAAAAGWSGLRYLAVMKQPTLILTGDDDPLVRPYNSRLLKWIIPNSRLQVIKGEGHFMVVSSADKIANHIRSFLSSD